MLQWLYMYIASICFKCFTYFRPMLQVFHLDVAYVVMLQMFQTHVASASIQNVSSVSAVHCKCVYLDVVVAIHICCKKYVCKYFTCFRRMLQKCFHVATLAGLGSGRMQMRYLWT